MAPDGSTMSKTGREFGPGRTGGEKSGFHGAVVGGNQGLARRDGGDEIALASLRRRSGERT